MIQLPLPPDELRFMGENDAAFLSIGDGLVSQLQSIAGLQPNSSIASTQ